MKLRHALAVFAAGTLAFLWSCFSWMVIPWHVASISVFEDETVVGRVVKEAAAEPGIYTYPGWTDNEMDMKRKHEEGPFIFASVVPQGVGTDMTRRLINGWLISLVGAAVLLIIVLLSPQPSWKQRTLVAAVAALFVSLVPALMNWTWWHFPIGFTLVSVVDGFIGWALAGVVLARATEGRIEPVEPRPARVE